MRKKCHMALFTRTPFFAKGVSSIKIRAQKKWIRSQSYKTLISSFFQFSLLSLVILKYRQYFLMLQILKLNNEKQKKKIVSQIKKFGMIDSRSILWPNCKFKLIPLYRQLEFKEIFYWLYTSAHVYSWLRLATSCTQF